MIDRDLLHGAQGWPLCQVRASREIGISRRIRNCRHSIGGLTFSTPPDSIALITKPAICWTRSGRDKLNACTSFLPVPRVSTFRGFHNVVPNGVCGVSRSPERSRRRAEGEESQRRRPEEFCGYSVKRMLSRAPPRLLRFPRCRSVGSESQKRRLHEKETGWKTCPSQVKKLRTTG
jgi:hypothetical protein